MYTYIYVCRRFAPFIPFFLPFFFFFFQFQIQSRRLYINEGNDSEYFLVVELSERRAGRIDESHN